MDNAPAAVELAGSLSIDNVKPEGTNVTFPLSSTEVHSQNELKEILLEQRRLIELQANHNKLLMEQMNSRRVHKPGKDRNQTKRIQPTWWLEPPPVDEPLRVRTEYNPKNGKNNLFSFLPWLW